MKQAFMLACCSCLIVALLTTAASAAKPSCDWKNVSYGFDLDWRGLEGAHDEGSVASAGSRTPSKVKSFQLFCSLLAEEAAKVQAKRQAQVLELPICQAAGLCREMVSRVQLSFPLFGLRASTLYLLLSVLCTAPPSIKSN